MDRDVGYFDMDGNQVPVHEWEFMRSYNPGRDREITTIPDGDGYATIVVHEGRFAQLILSADRREAIDTHRRAYPFEQYAAS